MWLSTHPLMRLSYLVPIGLIAGVAAWASLPWWALAVAAGIALLVWDWLWGFEFLTELSTPWLALLAGVLGLAASFLLAQNLGLNLDEFVQLRASAPRRAGWLYWLPGTGLGLVVYGLALRCMQACAKP